MVNMNSTGSGSRHVKWGLEHFPYPCDCWQKVSTQIVLVKPAVNGFICQAGASVDCEGWGPLEFEDTHLSFIIKSVGLRSWKNQWTRVFVTKSCVVNFCVPHSYLQTVCTVPYTCTCMCSLISWLCCIILHAILDCSLLSSRLEQFEVESWKPWLLNS